MGMMRTLGRRGDDQIEWDANNPTETRYAKECFDEAIKKGFKAFLISGRGGRGKQITTFDPLAEAITIVPQMGGGQPDQPPSKSSVLGDEGDWVEQAILNYLAAARPPQEVYGWIDGHLSHITGAALSAMGGGEAEVNGIEAEYTEKQVRLMLGMYTKWLMDEVARCVVLPESEVEAEVRAITDKAIKKIDELLDASRPTAQKATARRHP